MKLLAKAEFAALKVVSAADHLVLRLLNKRKYDADQEILRRTVRDDLHAVPIDDVKSLH